MTTLRWWFLLRPIAKIDRNAKANFAVHCAQDDCGMLNIHENVSVILQNHAARILLELFELVTSSLYFVDDRFVRVILLKARRHVWVGVFNVEQVDIG